IFLPLRTQEILLTCQRVVFAIYLALSSLTIFCLLTKTPAELAKTRNYLVMIQISITVTSFYVDILFEPIPLFPAYAGYCVGILCQLGASAQKLLSILWILYIFTGCSIAFCCIHRHQTLIPNNNAAKF
ncbi:hypothetical protein PFISCL1PPCAC_17203, partial [Pristionchus fissidentatus]